MKFRLTHDVANDVRLLWQEPREVIMKGVGAFQKLRETIFQAADRFRSMVVRFAARVR